MVKEDSERKGSASERGMHSTWGMKRGTLKDEEMQLGVAPHKWRGQRCEGETLVGKLGYQSIDARRRSTCQRARR